MAKTEKNLQGIIDEAYFFGQIPTMLFKKPHEKRDKKDKKDPVCKEIITKGNSFTSARSMSLTKKGKVHALLLCGKVVIVIKSEDNKYFMIKIKANKFIEEFVLKNFCLVEPMHWPGSFYWKKTFPEDINMVLDLGPHAFSIFQEKYLVSAFHVDGSLRLHTLDGNVYKCFYVHTGLVTSVTTTQNFIISAGIGCSILCWDETNEWKRYLGHKYAVRQLAANESYQILLSLDCAGVILMHDLRTSECLRKVCTSFNKPPKSIALSDFGVIAVAFTEERRLEFFSISGCEKWELKDFSESVWSMKFDKTGDYLVCGGNENINVFHVFTNERCCAAVETSVIDFAILPDEEGIVFVLHQIDDPKIYFTV